MLTIENISAGYGGIRALDNVSLHVEEGEIVSVLGANGAGKTTLLKCICSAMKTTNGIIKFNGQKMPEKPYNAVKQGLTHVPEGRQIFANLTVLENLKVGGYLLDNKTDFKMLLDYVYQLFPRLEERKNQYGGLLSGGEQQMLAIGRALMSKPKLMILDEPSLGLAPIIVTQIFEILKKVQEQGTSILLVEQNAYKALSISDRAYIMNVGKIVNEGQASELIKDKSLVEAYLGS